MSEPINLPDGTTHEGGHLLHNLLLFGRVCKLLDMDITPNVMIEVAHALGYVNMGNPGDVYHAMRVLMVNRQRDLELFDEAFDLFWQRPMDNWRTIQLPAIPDEKQGRRQILLEAGARPIGNASELPKATPTIDLTAIVPTYSQAENLRHKDFAEMTGAEIAMARKIIEHLPQSLGFRLTRRFRAGKGRFIDLRHTMRQNMRFAGEMMHLPTMTPRLKPRPLVLICDISGSMERYTRIFLHFMHTFCRQHESG